MGQIRAEESRAVVVGAGESIERGSHRDAIMRCDHRLLESIHLSLTPANVRVYGVKLNKGCYIRSLNEGNKGLFLIK